MSTCISCSGNTDHRYSPVVMSDSDVLYPVEIFPVFGAVMDRQINCHNSLELPDSFYLNSFSDKEMHHHFVYNFA